MEKNIKLAIGIAAGGIFLGIFSLVFALSARTSLERFQSEREEEALVFQERWDELSQAVNRQVSRLERELEGVSGTSSSSAAQFTDLMQQTQGAFDSIGAQIRRLNDDLARVASTARLLDERIGDLEESTPLPVAATASTASQGGGQSLPLDSGERLSYQVQSGDTLSGIARRFELPLRVLEENNPGIDSRRLQVGQEIVIQVGE